MTRDDITRMAREAGYSDSQDWSVIVRFAALVAAHEREKVAAWMIERSYATGHGDTTEDLLKELEWQIAERATAEREQIIAANAPEIEKINKHFKALEDALAAERERCAQICDSIAANAVLGTANECAAAIRARSKA